MEDRKVTLRKYIEGKWIGLAPTTYTKFVKHKDGRTVEKFIDDTEANFKTSTSALANTNLNVSKNKNDIATANTNIQKNRTDIGTANTNIANNKRDIDSLRNGLNGANTNISNNKKDITSLRNDINSANSNIVNNKKEISGLRNELNTTNNNINNNKKEIGTANASIQKNKNDINSANTNIANNKRDIGNLRNDLTTATNKIAQNTNSISSLSNTVNTKATPQDIDKKINSVKFNDVNLLINSGYCTNTDYWSSNVGGGDTANAIYVDSGHEGDYHGINLTNTVKSKGWCILENDSLTRQGFKFDVSKEYVISGLIWTNNKGNVYMQISDGNANNHVWGDTIYIKGWGYQYFEFKFQPKSKGNENHVRFSLGTQGQSIFVPYVKLQEGNKATLWCPSKYDNPCIKNYKGNIGVYAQNDGRVVNGLASGEGDFMSVRGTLNANEDLNNYTTTGFYHQNGDYDASTGKNYPPNNARAGLLSVVACEGFVYQTYQVYKEFSCLYYRNRYNGSWGAWKSVRDEGNATFLQGKELATGGLVYNRVPYVGGDGVMEIGKYIDFHVGDNDGDYKGRIEWNNNYFKFGDGTTLRSNYVEFSSNSFIGYNNNNGSSIDFIIPDYAIGIKQFYFNRDMAIEGNSSFYFNGRDRRMMINTNGYLCIGNNGWTQLTEMSASKFIVWSDENAKTDIKEVQETTLDKIKKMGVKSYYFKEDVKKLQKPMMLFATNKNFNEPIKLPEKKNIGLIAQEVKEIVPELVEKISMGDNNEKESITVDLYGLVSLVVKSVQELSDKVDKLEEENKKLKTLIDN